MKDTENECIKIVFAYKSSNASFWKRPWHDPIDQQYRGRSGSGLPRPQSRSAAASAPKLRPDVGHQQSEGSGGIQWTCCRDHHFRIHAADRHYFSLFALFDY